MCTFAYLELDIFFYPTHMAMGQNPVPPVNIPIPTKINETGWSRPHFHESATRFGVENAQAHALASAQRSASNASAAARRALPESSSSRGRYAECSLGSDTLEPQNEEATRHAVARKLKKNNN